MFCGGFSQKNELLSLCVTGMHDDGQESGIVRSEA